jgi:integrase
MAEPRRITSGVIESTRKYIPAKGQVLYWDNQIHGLALRISQGGTRTWVLLYRMHRQGNSRWLKLGTCPPLSWKDARDIARDKQADVQKGNDPAVGRQVVSGGTFGVLAGRYLREYAEQHKRARSVAEDRRNISKDLLPVWGERPAGSIAPEDVIALLDAIAARPAPIQANRTLALISKIFNFGIDKRIPGVTANPARKLSKPGKENSRDRALSPKELRAWWGAVEQESPPARDIFKLLLLLGQRRTEVLEMLWSEIDLDAARWTIPGERTKNHQTHVVPLVGGALAILTALQAASPGATGFVFPARSGDVRFGGMEGAQKRIIDRAGVAFRVHDLRRTLGTGLGDLGVDRTVLKKILNHSEGKDVTAIYDRHRYDTEKRTALVRWDRRVHEIVEDRAADKVVALHA